MSQPKQPSALSHVDARGEVRMVDVSGKAVTIRTATASATVRMKADVLDAVYAETLPKGDALATARIAGITAAKRTSEWIPLCHPLPLDWVCVDFSRDSRETLSIRCTTKTSARTGVEMEALTGVMAAALALYDMAKAADKSIVIGPIRVERKTGGRSGDYQYDEGANE